MKIIIENRKKGKITNNIEGKLTFKQIGIRMLCSLGVLTIVVIIRVNTMSYTQLTPDSPAVMKLLFYGNYKPVSDMTIDSIVQDVKLPESTVENSNIPEPKQELASRGTPRSYILPRNKLEEMALAECKFIGLDEIVGFAFIHAESRWEPKSVNVNKRKKSTTTDFGLMQLNDSGKELGDALGKTLTLSDGRKVKVTKSNYKTDNLLNLHIGLSAAKEYLDLTKNVYAAYAMYNIGTSIWYDGLINVVNLSQYGANDTADFVEEYGFERGAYNIRTNFSKSFEKYLKIKEETIKNSK